MSDIKLFRFTMENAEELSGRLAQMERNIHDLMERHMECFLGIRFVAHEYSTGRTHGGRIDSLGLDENCCPVIIEYKRHTNENVINQGLYYLDWLLDHKAEFKLLVMEHFDKKTADTIDWSGTRVLCVAGDFTKFDEHAVAQIGRNIELIRYKYFDDNLLLLEWLNPVRSEASPATRRINTVAQSEQAESTELSEPATESELNSNGSRLRRTLAWHLANMPQDLRPLYDDLVSFVMSLGDDVNAKELLRYLAFTRLKNFVCLLPLKSGFKLWLKLNPASVSLEKNFSRDVSGVGHWGTGDVEISVRNRADFEKAKLLIERAYQES